MTVKVAVLPQSTSYIDDAIALQGGVKADLGAADALVWTGSNQSGFPAELPAGLRWVQLKSAGVQPWLTSGTIDDGRIWTSAAGAYSRDVAEHAVALLLGGLRQFAFHTRVGTWAKEQTWMTVRSLRGRKVAIVGAGGIGRAAIPVLTALGAEVIAVNRSGRPVEGATRTLPSSGLDEALTLADDAILAGASTAETYHLIGADQLAALGRHSDSRTPGIIVNVARGDLIDADAMIGALRDGTIAGAGLDVFDPEPLPDDSPLWTMDNVLITPHVANPKGNLDVNFGSLVAENLRRFSCGEELRAVIDLGRQY